jgi:hypothetical protein
MLSLKYQCTLSLGRGEFANHLRSNWDDLEIFEIGQSPLRIIRAKAWSISIWNHVGGNHDYDSGDLAPQPQSRPIYACCTYLHHASIL